MKYKLPESRHPYQDAKLTTDERLRDLLPRMTLDEKIAQCVLGPVEGMTLHADGSFSIAEETKELTKHGMATFRNVARKHSPAHMVRFGNHIQQYLMNETRLGIPTFFHEECLHGLLAPEATVFPQAIALASSWDEDLIERVFTAIAKESRTRGVHQAKTPVLDLATDARWGRIQETYGEDPYLAARIGLAAVRGFQGREKGVVGKNRVACMLKHLAGYGQSLGGRNFAPSPITRRELMDQVMVPFEVAVKEGGALGIMPSHNEIDGIPTHSNREMLTEILRDEWGFDGLILSDWDDIHRIHSFHHAAEDVENAAILGISAGVDIEQPGNAYFSLKAAIEDGRMSENILDTACRRVLRLKFDMGLFDNPYADEAEATAVSRCPEHRALAKEAADKSIILLKNHEHFLPLKKENYKKIAVIGPNAAEPHHGIYSTVPHDGVSILQGIRDKFKDAEVVYAEGTRIVTKTESTFEREGDELDTLVTLEDESANRKRLAEALDVVSGCELIVLCVGGNEKTAKEAIYMGDDRGDRDDLSLLGMQDELIDKLAQTGIPIVGVLNNGRPLACQNLLEKSHALFELWFAGEAGGASLADALCGDVNPSGKLTMTFPRNVGQIPIGYSQKPSGYHKKYLLSEDGPLFPFGFGLSYTTFEYGKLSVDKAVINAGEAVTVSFTLTNTGSHDGAEVVQLYLRDLYSSVARPIKELKAFKKIQLKAGEVKTVSLNVPAEAMSFTGRDLQKVIEPGTFVVMVGTNSSEFIETSFEVK